LWDQHFYDGRVGGSGRAPGCSLPSLKPPRSNLGIVTFTRDRRQRIDGLLVDTGRV
jgi:hypothetical protein